MYFVFSCFTIAYYLLGLLPCVVPILTTAYYPPWLFEMNTAESINVYEVTYKLMLFCCRLGTHMLDISKVSCWFIKLWQPSKFLSIIKCVELMRLVDA